MLKFKRLALVFSLLCAAVPADARTRKGDRFLKEGREAETRKQWEQALSLYEQALLEDPTDPGYMIAAQRIRFQAAMTRVDAGQKLRSLGQLEAAADEFQKAYAIDPSSAMAEQELKRTQEMIELEKKGGAAITRPEDRALTPVDRANQQAEEKSSRMLAIPELKPIIRRMSTLKMTNQPRVLFEAVGKYAGINVIFDPEYQAPQGRTNFSIDVSNLTVEEALDYLAVQTKSFWKPLSPNTIFVTLDNINKRRDYEDFVVKVFYIKNANTVTELQEILQTVRSVTEIRRGFTYNAQNAILFRGSADQIALAEKLIQDLDKPKAEVVIDVIVMQANRSKVRDLAATLTTNGGKAGIQAPVVFGDQTTNAEGATTGTNSTIRLNKFNSIGLGDFSIAVPGAFLQALASDSTTKVLQQPQVRAVENYKASLRIGDKVPYASGSFQPGVGSVGVNPLVSTQFQFFEVGVNVDITPKVHGRDEVSMHIELEISNVADRVVLGGIEQPIISQKKIIHDLRLKEGEVNILGGLIQMQDTRVISGIPGLMSIPIIGRLFSTEHVEHPRGELLIALVPHIVRAPEYSEANLRGVAAGNDQTLQLRFAPRPDPPAEPVPAAVPATAPTTPTAAPVVPAQAAPDPVAPNAPARIVFSPAAMNTQLSSAVTVTLQAENVQDLFSAPLRMKFDPKVLRLTNVRQGALIAGDGQKVNMSENTQNDTGEVSVTLNRLPGSGGISGSGALLTFTFQAIGKGAAQIAVTSAELKDSMMQPIKVELPAVSVVVQ